MDEVIKQIIIYQNLYGVCLGLGMIFLSVAMVLLIRWKIYRPIVKFMEKQRRITRNTRMKKRTKEVKNEQSNITVKLKAIDNDGTELINQRT